MDNNDEKRKELQVRRYCSTNPPPIPKSFSSHYEDKRELICGNWTAHLNGDLEYTKRDYWITKDRLSEDYWIIHLFGKGWIDWSEFIPAYFQACRNADVKFVKMKMYY